MRKDVVITSSPLETVTQKAERIRRDAYLSSRGFPTDAPVQLDLVFEDMIAKKPGYRHMPNDIARSALFTVRHKSRLRENFQDRELFHYSKSVSLRYTGQELRAEDDEPVWLQIMRYAAATPAGEEFGFDLRTLIADVDWTVNGRNYARLRSCIMRLNHTQLVVHNSEAYGKSLPMRLIDLTLMVNDGNGNPTQFRAKMNPNMLVLFAGATFTSHQWTSYLRLSPVARRLADYVGSHASPYALSVERFRHLCASENKTAKSWLAVVRGACDELAAAGMVSSAAVSGGLIECVRTPRATDDGTQTVKGLASPRT